MTAFLIAAGIASLIPISGLLWRAIGWIRERLVYRELGIVAISGIERPEPLGEARIRLAYGGNRLLLVRSVRVKFSLRYRRWRDRTLGWLQIILGYLTNDIEGMRELAGPQITWLHQGWIFRIMNFIYGLLNLAFLLSQVISPIGWMFIFLTGPYDSRELKADDEQIHIREAETGIEHRLPFILEPKTEKVYIITYDYSLKRKHFDEGFPRNARIECVADVKRRPWWKLPRAGDGVWLADGTLFVQTAGKWIKFKTHLGPSLVRLHLPLKDFSCD